MSWVQVTTVAAPPVTLWVNLAFAVQMVPGKQVDTTTIYFGTEVSPLTVQGTPDTIVVQMLTGNAVK